MSSTYHCIAQCCIFRCQNFLLDNGFDSLCCARFNLSSAVFLASSSIVLYACQNSLSSPNSSNTNFFVYVFVSINLGAFVTRFFLGALSVVVARFRFAGELSPLIAFFMCCRRFPLEVVLSSVSDALSVSFHSSSDPSLLILPSFPPHHV